MFKNLSPQINKIIISLNNSRNYVLSSGGINNCGLNLKNNNNNYYHLQQTQTRYCNNHKINNNTATKGNKSSINNNMTSSATDDTNIGSSSSSAPMHTNRLIHEKSPYLLQHAHNPVDWYPWGDEALQRAKNENKLIFLSVGYSTCHWCHVMEKESFEDIETANILNTHFISIKVDREERPDIDKNFMQFTVALTGSGGWPMSVWLTSDIVPLTAGTYFPPTSRWGMPSFKTVLKKVNDHWKSFDASDHLKLKALQESLHSPATTGTTSTNHADDLEIEEKFYEAIKIYTANFDKFWGGFKKSGPKFPEASKLSFLIDAHIQQSDKEHQHTQQQQRSVLPVLTETLTKIANGGIHDHVFGGFARYSVDERWHIPHFEKMLYDQGQLLSVYTNAYRVTRNPLFLSIADKLIEYCIKDLKHPLGGFFSGEDADSYPTAEAADKIEGAFYAWTLSEIRECCEKNSTLFSIVEVEAAIKMYSMYYDVQEKGNVLPSSDPHGHLTGKNVLMINTHTLADLSDKFKCTEEVIVNTIDIINGELHKIRDERPRPHLDTKIITAWNGLLLSGISELASLKQNNKKYLQTARSLTEFIKSHLYNSDTNTVLRACYGKAIGDDSISVLSSPVNGFLDDYAFLIRGLLDYYLLSLDADVLHWARALQTKQDELFWDDIDGGYYYSEKNEQITQLKDDHDMAEPSGNSIAAFNLLLLGGYFEDKSYKEKAKRIYQLYNTQKPFGYIFPKMLSSMLLFDNGLTMIVVVGSQNDDTNKLFDCIRQFYIPGLLLFHFDPKNSDSAVEPTRPSIVQFKMVNEQTTVYVCQNKVCQMPILTYEQLYESLSMKYLFNN